jgi:hypothetical protein
MVITGLIGRGTTGNYSGPGEARGSRATIDGLWAIFTIRQFPAKIYRPRAHTILQNPLPTDLSLFTVTVVTYCLLFF